MGDDQLRKLTIPPEMWDPPAPAPPWQFDPSQYDPHLPGLNPLQLPPDLAPSPGTPSNPWLQPLPPPIGNPNDKKDPQSLLDDWGALKLPPPFSPIDTPAGPLTLSPLAEGPGLGPFQFGLPDPRSDQPHAPLPDPPDGE